MRAMMLSRASKLILPTVVDALQSFHDIAHASYDLDDETYADGNEVTSLTDQTGNGHTASHGTAGERPTAQTVNSHKVMRFDGSDDRLKTSNWTTISQPNTIMCLVKWSSSGSYFLDGLTKRNAMAVLSNNWAMYAGSGTIQDGAAGTAWHVLTGVFNSTSKLYVDGGASAASGSIGTHGSDGLYFGTSTSLTSFWAGDMNFVGIYNGDLVADNLSVLNSTGQALADRMGITWTDISS